MVNEKDIIERVLSGDMDSFRLILEQYQGLVFSICLNMTGDRFESENLTQEIFIKVYKSLFTYEFRGFKTWISRIAVNRCLDYKRHIAGYRKELVLLDELPEQNDDSAVPVEELLIIREEASAVRAMCNALPEIYRSVLTEYFMHSKSIQQIAIENELNKKTVETRLYRALKMLGRKWKEEYG